MNNLVVFKYILPTNHKVCFARLKNSNFFAFIKIILVTLTNYLQNSYTL